MARYKAYQNSVFSITECTCGNPARKHLHWKEILIVNSVILPKKKLYEIARDIAERANQNGKI